MRDITRAVKPPRAAFLDFPPGHTSGPAFNRALQEGIVRAALGGLETITESGTILALPYAWPDGDAWKQMPLPERLPREETPQYQCDADRAAVSGHAAACPVCVLD